MLRRDRRQPNSQSSGQGGSAATFAVTEEHRERRFWLSQLYAALIAFFAGVIVFFLYSGLTWVQPNRELFMFTGGGILLLLIPSVYALRDRIVAWRHRLLFFYIWSFSSFLLVVWLSYLDGGLGSPAAWLLFLPVL